MDVLGMGLGRDILLRKSSAGSRTELAQEGRHQPVMQPKVLKVQQNNQFMYGEHPPNYMEVLKYHILETAVLGNLQ